MTIRDAERTAPARQKGRTAAGSQAASNHAASAIQANLGAVEGDERERRRHTGARNVGALVDSAGRSLTISNSYWSNNIPQGGGGTGVVRQGQWNGGGN